MLAIYCVSIDIMFVPVCHSYLQEGGARKLRTSQPHFDPWEGDVAGNPGTHFQAHEGQEALK